MDTQIQMSPITARLILRALLAIEFLFALIYIVEITLGSPSHLLHELVNLDAERTIPSWFSSIQLCVIGLVFLHFTFNVPFLQTYQRLFALMSLGFIFMSLDENISIHERITYRYQDVEWLPRFQGNHGIWISVYLVIAVIFLLVNLKPMLTLIKQYPHNARIFVLGGALFVAGGLLMEIIGYYLVGEEGPGLAYYLEVTIEEFLEMAGASVMLYSILFLRSTPD